MPTVIPTRKLLPAALLLAPMVSACGADQAAVEERVSASTLIAYNISAGTVPNSVAEQETA